MDDVTALIEAYAAELSDLHLKRIGDQGMYDRALTRLAKVARAAIEAERKACAQLADDLIRPRAPADDDVREAYDEGRNEAALEIREAIRARA